MIQLFLLIAYWLQFQKYSLFIADLIIVQWNLICETDTFFWKQYRFICWNDVYEWKNQALEHLAPSTRTLGIFYVF